MGINLTGTHNCTHVTREYLKDGGGTVLNISSVAGIRGAVKQIPYGVVKAGVINFTRTLAFEWAADGVRVNCIALGFVATEVLEEHWGVSATNIERFETNRRVKIPREIADIARFSLSSVSSFVNRKTIITEGVPRVEQNVDIPSLDEAGR